jgi:putative ABC transport system substrate-binding protein
MSPGRNVGSALAPSAGLVVSLARPGDNITGFTQLEYSTSAKWLELLKEVAPGMTRTAVTRRKSSVA